MEQKYNLYPLHVFRAVVRCASMTAAAAELGITQPAVSAHVRALETRFGEPLLVRGRRGLRLTERGSRVLDFAERLCSLLDELDESGSGPPAGRVIVAASSTPGAWLLPERLRDFHAAFPEVHAVLTVAQSAAVVEAVREGRASLGVVGALTGGARGLARCEVWRDEVRLVAAHGCPLARRRQLAARDVADQTLLLREPGSSTRWYAEEMLAELLPSFGAVFEIASAEAIKEAVVAGLGVAVLSSWATRREEAAGLLRPVADRRFRASRPFHLVRHGERHLSAAARALWTFLEGTCG